MGGGAATFLIFRIVAAVYANLPWGSKSKVGGENEGEYMKQQAPSPILLFEEWIERPSVTAPRSSNINYLRTVLHYRDWLKARVGRIFPLTITTFLEQ